MPTTAPKTPKAAPKSPEAVAKSHATPADTLRSIFESRSMVYDRYTNERRDAKPTLMAAVAQNPNTPLDILAALLPAYPAAFCQNPIAPFLLLEKPDFLAGVEPKAQLALLRCADAPASLVRTIAAGGGNFPEADRFIADEARQHIAFAGELDAEAWPETLTTVCREFCTTASVDEKQFVADYRELGLLPDWPEGEAPVPPWNDTSLGAALIGKTDNDNGAGALLRAFSAETAPEQCYTLAALHSPVISLALAAFNGTPAEVLPNVAYENVRNSFLAASHPNADAKLLSHLAAHPSPAVRRTARRHAAAPADAGGISRSAILRTPAVSPFWYLLTGMGVKLELVEIRPRPHSPRWMVRLSAVFALTNGKTRLTAERREMLLGLSEDSNRFVRAAAKTCLADPAFRFAW